MKQQIDILLVIYNQSQYILQALDGIFAQRLNDNQQLCIIVADDCSTDGTLNIIKTYAQKHKAEWVFLPNEKNLGHVRNYQRAFAACTGDYVAIIEGDDYWSSPLHLQMHIDFLESHPECVLTTQCPVWYYEEEKYFDLRENIYIGGMGYRAISIIDEIRDNQITNLSSCVIRGHAIRNIDKKIFTCSILDWPLYIDLYRFGLLCVLSGTSNVYRSNNSGIYSGLDDDGQKQARLRYLNDLAKVFPQYEPYLNEAKDKLMLKKKTKSATHRIAEVLLYPFVAIHRLCRRIARIYKQML